MECDKLKCFWKCGCAECVNHREALIAGSVFRAARHILAAASGVHTSGRVFLDATDALEFLNGLVESSIRERFGLG